MLNFLFGASWKLPFISLLKLIELFSWKKPHCAGATAPRHIALVREIVV